MICSSQANSVAKAGFWISLAALPFGVAIYQYTNKDGNSYFTRTLSGVYSEYKAQFAQRNELHTTAMEQAAADRVLFLNETPKQPRWVNIRFPEYVMPSIYPRQGVENIQAAGGRDRTIWIV